MLLSLFEKSICIVRDFTGENDTTVVIYDATKSICALRSIIFYL